jgi:hypothetical protein
MIVSADMQGLRGEGGDISPIFTELGRNARALGLGLGGVAARRDIAQPYFPQRAAVLFTIFLPPLIRSKTTPGSDLPAADPVDDPRRPSSPKPCRIPEKVMDRVLAAGGMEIRRGVAVAIKSFLDNNTWYTGDIIVICWGRLSLEQKLRIGSLSAKIEFCEIDEGQYSKARIDGHRAWNYNPACRFSIFWLTRYDRLVYLDADVVVTAGIRELFKTAASFGACRLKPGEGMELRDRGGFNAGVLTIGSKFISEEVHDSLMKIATARPWSGNQVILNLQFGEIVEYISQDFNMTTDQLTDITFDTAKILHFVGEEKPWHSTCRISARRIATIGEPVAARALEVWDHWASKCRGMAD